MGTLKITKNDDLMIKISTGQSVRIGALASLTHGGIC